MKKLDDHRRARTNRQRPSAAVGTSGGFHCIRVHHHRRTPAVQLHTQPQYAPGCEPLVTPLDSQGGQLPTLPPSALRIPIFASGHMSWADTARACQLAVLEAVRDGLDNEPSQLLMMADITEQANTLLADDGRANQLTRNQVVSIISAWRMFPLSTYALEASPRRVGAVITHYRLLGRSLAGRAGYLLERLGRSCYLDAVTDPPWMWADDEESSEGASTPSLPRGVGG
jgi:hypothetical protein